MFFKKLNALPSVSQETLAKLYTFVYHYFPGELAMSSEDTPDLWSTIDNADEGKTDDAKGTEKLEGIRQRGSYNETILDTMVIQCGQEGEELPCMSAQNVLRL